MRASTAAALVGAGALSTLAGPIHGLRLRRNAAKPDATTVREEEISLDRPIALDPST
jgi:hypothetical protein